MNKSNNYLLKKSIVSSAIAVALSIGVVPNSQADIYNFTFDNGGCSAGVTQSCSQGINPDYLDRETDGPDADTDTNESSDAFFTLLNPEGGITRNTSEPYTSHYYWYGIRTPLNGNITIDEGNGVGIATIDGFDFFSSGPAVAKDISMTYVGDGSGNVPTPAGDLWIGQMLFDWNKNNGIPLSIVWNMSGLMSSLPGLDVNDLAATANAISGGTNVGVLGASDGFKVALTGVTQPAPDFKGDIDMSVGELLIATTDLNTTPLCLIEVVSLPTTAHDGVNGAKNTPADSPSGCMTVNPSGTTPVLADSVANTNTGNPGVAGTPMIDGPFPLFNASFDFKRLTLAGYNDTTPPVMTVVGGSVTLIVGDTFSADTPTGITLGCTDNADIAADLQITNVSTVNMAISGQYKVTYTCTDSAGLRAAIPDPANPTAMTSPVDNAHSVDLIVNVNAPGQPSITITADANGVTTPVNLEACTAYSDAGATAVDANGNAISPVLVTDNNGIIGQQPNEISATIDYDITFLTVAAQTQIRTVNVVDTLAPVLTVPNAPFSMESTACAAFAANLPVATVADANNCNTPSPATATSSSTVTCVVPDGQDSIESGLVYTANDTSAAANAGSVAATVLVSRSEPVITLNGGGLTFGVGGEYIEQGMFIHDVQDGDIGSPGDANADPVVEPSGALIASGSSNGTGAGVITYTITNNINVNVEGDYTVTYTATDSDNNAATVVTRSVTVGAYSIDGNFSMMDPAGGTYGGANDVVLVWDETALLSVTDTRSNMSMFSAKPTKFNSAVWTAHDGRIFGPGTYSFDSGCTVAEVQGTGCVAGSAANSETAIAMTVGDGQLGMHVLFDWNGNLNIDVVNVWDRNQKSNNPDGQFLIDAAGTSTNDLFLGETVLPQLPPAPDAIWDLVSRDVNGNGFNGAPMVDGPFGGHMANFNFGPDKRLDPNDKIIITTETVDTKLGSGSIGLGLLLTSLLSLVSFGLYRRRS